MSDDLISRMALMEEIEHSFIIPILKINLRSEHEAVLKIREIIMNMPTAFDKEKVIEELKKYADIAFETDDAYMSELAYGEWTAYKQSAKIVEKGGIE